MLASSLKKCFFFFLNMVFIIYFFCLFIFFSKLSIKSKNLKWFHFGQTLDMTLEIMDSFRSLLKETTWIDPETKMLAEGKLDAMTLRIGYPEFILITEQLNDRYKDVINRVLFLIFKVWRKSYNNLLFFFWHEYYNQKFIDDIFRNFESIGNVFELFFFFFFFLITTGTYIFINFSNQNKKNIWKHQNKEICLKIFKLNGAFENNIKINNFTLGHIWNVLKVLRS